jgi:hypothetical protein
MWLGVVGDHASSTDDSSMIVSCWCISVGATYHISKPESSSDSEPNKGDPGGGVRVHPKENLPFKYRFCRRASS